MAEFDLIYVVGSINTKGGLNIDGSDIYIGVIGEKGGGQELSLIKFDDTSETIVDQAQHDVIGELNTVGS